MEITGKAFIEHWNWAAEKGVMNKNTAAGLRAACTQVLSALDNWESVDIKSLDVEGTLTRFQNLKHKDFKPAVLDTYKRRFRQAVSSYLKYLEDPAGWKPRTLERAPVPEKTNGGDRTPGSVRTTMHEIPQTGLVEYPFPLRDSQIARLVLPRDLKSSEVKRLSAFMSTLTVDFDQNMKSA
jgi:hypothetical protein